MVEVIRGWRDLSASQRGAAVAVGPEGDWTGEELDELEREGFSRVSLGPRVMRSHTAGVVAVGVLTMMLDGDVNV